ncbi:hypothetical protein BH18ACT13_BH18ACT13_02290 [soil metagenome]
MRPQALPAFRSVQAMIDLPCASRSQSHQTPRATKRLVPKERVRAAYAVLVRVHVISDMEGVAGIVKWQQVGGGEPLYEEGRRLYTGEINAAVRGAKAAGATEIVVMDCHGAGEGWTFNSLVPEELDADCEYVVQDEWAPRTRSRGGYPRVPPRLSPPKHRVSRAAHAGCGCRFFGRPTSDDPGLCGKR